MLSPVVLDWGCDLSSYPIPAGGRSDYLERLAAIREDPRVKHLARGRAGDPELAEDALQEAYYAVARMVARMEDPERIVDLRAYYCRVLLRSIHKFRSQLGAVLIEDFGAVAENCQRRPGGEPPSPPFDEAVGSYLHIQDLRRYLAAHRATLSYTIPGRSPDLARYREVVVTVTEHMLLGCMAGGLSDAEQNRAFRTLYPDWFAEAEVAVSNIHQRFARARADVCRLLQEIIKRSGLYF